MKIKSLIPLVFILTVNCAFGQKVGYVDSKKIFAQYRGSDDIKQEVNRMIETWNREVAVQRKVLDSLEKKLEETDLVISSERRKAKKEEINTKRQELEKFVKEVFDQGGKADQKNRELSKPMAEKIGNVVKKVALDNNLLMILDSSSGLVVYSSKELDITEQVLEELSKEEGTAAKVLSTVTVFPVWELDPESIKKKYGRQVQEHLISSIEKSQKVQATPKKQVEDLVKEKGLSKAEIKENRGLEMAKILYARYMTFGTITQNLVNNQITITLKLYNAELDQFISEEIEKVNGENEILIGCDKLLEKITQRILQ